MPSTGLAGTDAHFAHDARTVLIKIPFMIKELLDWMFLCSPDTEPPPKRIRNQSFPLLATGNIQKQGTLSPCHPSTISLTLELLGKCPRFLKSNCYFLVMVLSVFQKLSTRAALIGINASIELILCDSNLVSPPSGLKGNHLGYFYGRPIPIACILARRGISPMMLWQGGRKLGLAERPEKQKPLLGEAELHGQGREKEQHCKIKAQNLAEQSRSQHRHVPEMICQLLIELQQISLHNI